MRFAALSQRRRVNIYPAQNRAKSQKKIQNDMQTELKQISLNCLVNNTGQIAGVRANPRFIKDDDYRRLVKSLRAFDLTDILPLKVYPMGDKYVTIGGNMRLRALQEIKAQHVSCIVIPEDTPVELLNKAIILDNSTHGDWDWEMLANEWDADLLKEWGVQLPAQQPNEDLQDMSDKIQLEYRIEVTCTDEVEQEQLYNELIQEGFQCRLLTL